MGGDDFRKGNDFRKGDDFRKSSGSSIEEFERLMSGSKHTDSSVVRDIADRFFSELGKRVDDISNRNPFSLTLDARIDGGEKAQLNLFVRSVSAVLGKQKLTDYVFGHDGGDSFYNPYSGDEYILGGRGNPISQISFFYRPERAVCPCCNGTNDVDDEIIDHQRFFCRSNNCDLQFKVDCGFESYFGGKYPNCEICNDSEDVYWEIDPYYDHCGDCNEDYDDGAHGSGQGNGCGPFYCSDCSHRMNTGGYCVDPECDCEDWEDDDDDDDDY